MTKRYASFLALVLLAVTAFGRHIDPSEAMQAVTQFLSAPNGKHKAPTARPAELRLAYTAESSALNETYYYVFNRGTDNGYVIASADDRLVPVLGYSDSGSFDAGNLPDGLKYWLGEYEREIAYALANPSVAFADDNAADSETRTIRSASTPMKANASAYGAYGPLVSCHWDQGEPFNNLCPTFDGQHAVTGCVATAMAQIMYTHRWPEVGSGSANGVTFEGTRYDWNNMIDDYHDEYGNSLYNSANATAVATLMRHCGAAVNMDYSVYSSGANSLAVPQALMDFFGYDRAIRPVSRAHTDPDEYMAIIYNELREGRPIYYSGSDPNGAGHAFVLDGSDNEGRWHFNWGWGRGYCDGYYLPSALRPDGSGIGGNGDGGYDHNQTAVVGIQPLTGASQPDTYPLLAGGGDFSYDRYEKYFTTVNGDFDGFMNMSTATCTFYISTKFVNTATHTEYNPSSGPSVSLRSGWYVFGAYSTPDLSKVPNGDYEVYPLYRINDSDEWHIIRMPNGMRQFVPATVANGNVTYGDAPSDPNGGPLSVTDITHPDVFKPGTDYTITATITNLGDYAYNHPITVGLETNGKFLVGGLKEFTIEIAGHESRTVKFPVQFNVVDGEYNLVFTDYKNNLICERIPVTVSSPTASDGIAIDATNFPNEIFRNYIATNFDANNDGYLSETEINAVTQINVASKGISSLDGINLFTNLSTLTCNTNNLQTLILSDLTKLKTVQCSENKLTELTFTNCKYLHQLYCENNRLTSLDLTDCTFGGSGYFGNPDAVLYANGNSLAVTVNEANCFDLSTLPGFDVSKASEWVGGTVEGNILTFEAETVTYSYDTGFKPVTFTLTTTLNEISPGIAIDATNFPDEIFRNYIATNFDTDGDGSLSETEINAVTEINVDEKGISSLEGIQHFKQLHIISCRSNSLANLDISNNTALTYLDCYSNKLTSLDVSNNIALNHLNCIDNSLTSLDVSNNTELTVFYCDTNDLTELDVSNNTKLRAFGCGGNNLTRVDVSNNTALTYLSCTQIGLTSLDISNNTKLIQLYCSNNNLTSLDVSNNTALEDLICSENKLTDLNVSNNPALKRLSCYKNQLTSFDISKSTAIQYLECSSNNLSDLDVSKCINLLRISMFY